jgi:hypothetical protein
MQMQSEIALEQISRDIWSAMQIVGPAEAFSGSPSTVATTVSEIRLYNADTLIFAAYKIENGRLNEAHPSPAAASLDGTDYRPFTVGGNQIITVSPNSNFQLAALRRSVTVNLAITTTQSNISYITPARGDLITCRNSR